MFTVDNWVHNYRIASTDKQALTLTQ